MRRYGIKTHARRTAPSTTSKPRPWAPWGTRFGRNVPLESTIPEPEPQLLTPSPRVVSRELMTRTEFTPATILNLLAAAWIQFQVHDWFSHGKNEQDKPFKLALTPDDPWPGDEMEIRRTRKDPTRDPESSDPIPTFVNTETHWWDASQVYGSSKAVMDAVRSGMDGKLVIGNDGLLPISPVNGNRNHGRDRQLVDRASHTSHPVHVGAQRHLQHVDREVPGLIRRGSVREGTADQLRPDRQDSHRRLDSLDSPSPDHRSGRARKLGGAWLGKMRFDGGDASAIATSSAAHQVLTPTITVCHSP